MTFIPPDRLIRALKNAGMSQKEIAMLSGASEPQISRILSGGREPSVELYFALLGLWETIARGSKNGD